MRNGKKRPGSRRSGSGKRASRRRTGSSCGRSRTGSSSSSTSTQTRSGSSPRWDSDPHTERKEQQHEKDEEDQRLPRRQVHARELREYEGTALGEYGVIDAELYTGVLDIDRGAMEYDNAGSMEEAVELARGLESELDAEEPEVKVTVIKETDETTEEEEVDAQQMIAGWESILRGQVASATTRMWTSARRA